MVRRRQDAQQHGRGGVQHVVLGLIFLKYISDAFEERHAALVAEKSKGADPEDPDEYRGENIFWVPKEARWTCLQGKAKQPTIGKLIDLIGTIGLGDKENRSKDILGRVYEYFLAQFASAEGKKGGQFYTPRCVVQVLVEMLAPYRGRVFDPCCGSGGMFVQSEKFVWFIARNKKNGRFRDRRGETLFIDARKLGRLIDRVHRELTDEEITRIAETYHAWRGDKGAGKYADVPGFCKSATVEEIRQHGHVLTPGRYAGAVEVEEEDELFQEKMKRLTAQLEEQFAGGARLERAIRENLEGLGYGR